MRIDSHLHVFARPSAEFPREITSSMPAEREAPVEDLLAHMADHAIDKAVLVQTGGTSLAHHAYLQHCLRTYPDRFLGIGLIPPDASAPADHMDRLAEDGSIIGFRLRSLGDFSQPDMGTRRPPRLRALALPARHLRPASCPNSSRIFPKCAS